MLLTSHRFHLLTKFFALFLLFGLPFVVLPFGTSYFEIPKVVVAEIVIELLVGLLLFKGSFSKHFFLQRVFYPYVVLFLITFIDLIFFQTSTAFFGNQFRLQGVFLLWHLMVFSLLTKGVNLHSISPRAIFVFLFLQALFALFLGANNAERAYGLLGEPNALAAIAVFAFPIVFYTRVKSNKPLLLCSLFLCCLLVFLSGSRSGFLGLVLEGVFLLLGRFGLSLKRTVLISLVLFLGFLIFPLFEQGIHENRSEIWHVAFVAGLKSPVLGWGFGNVEKAFAETTKTLSFPTFIGARYVDSAHNIFLDYFLQAGILGLGALITLLYFAFTTFVQREKRLEVALLFGILTVLSFNPSSVWTILVFWYLLGQATLEVRSEK